MLGIILAIVALVSATPVGATPSDQLIAAAAGSETAPQYPPPPTTAQRAPTYNKSDLPGGVEEPVQIPPGTVRIEDIKPGTKPKPQTVGETTPARAAPAAPAAAAPTSPAAPAVAPQVQPGEPQLYDTRMQPATRPAYSPPPPSTAAPSYPRAATAAPAGGCKSDLPGGACDEPAVPSGAKRIEDIKPGTRPKTIAGEAPPPPTPTPVVPPPAARPAYTPPPAPPPSYPAAPPPSYPAAPSRGGCKSDLPGGACDEGVAPPGTVRLEDIKPGTRPATGAAPAARPSAAPQTTGNIQERPVGADEQPGVQGKQRQRWE